METSAILYTRSDSGLCDEMKTILARVGTRIPFHLEEIDISTDVALERRYGLEIPVLYINGAKAFQYRTTEEELRKFFEKLFHC